MSSLGRPSLSIDLNTNTISAVGNLDDRVETLEDNVGEPSSQDILDENNDVIQEGNDASGLNLDVETLQNEVLVLQDQVGSDDVDPKTGIFLRLFDIEKADTIIPHYDVRGLYYDIINKTYEIESDNPNYESANIIIDNSSNLNLNEMILNMKKDISKLNKSNDYFREMIGESGFGTGNTGIHALLANITFNTQTLSGDFPTFANFVLPDDKKIDFDFEQWALDILNQIDEEIEPFVFDTVLSSFGYDREMLRQNLIKVQDPLKFLNTLLNTRVKIGGHLGIGGSLYVKDPHNTIVYLQEFVNVHENLVYVDDDDILEKNNLNTLVKKDFSLTINYKHSHFSKSKRYYSGEDIIEWTSGLVDDDGINIQEPETFKYELALEYPILGINPAQLKK